MRTTAGEHGDMEAGPKRWFYVRLVWSNEREFCAAVCGHGNHGGAKNEL